MQNPSCGYKSLADMPLTDLCVSAGGQRLDPVYAAFLVHLLQQISNNAPTMFTRPVNGTMTPQHASYNASDGRVSATSLT